MVWRWIMVCWVGIQSPVYSQVGARSMGYGNSSAVLEDEWAIFNNPAGLNEMKGTHMVSGYFSSYASVFSSIYLGFSLPVKSGFLGMGIERFGDDWFSRTAGKISFAHALGNTSLGLRAGYHLYQYRDLGTKGVFTLDFGGISQILTNFWVGAYISNLTQTLLDDDQDDRVPTILTFGLLYQPSSNTHLILEMEKDIDYSPEYKLGMEYSLLESMDFRVGISGSPLIFHFGTGLKLSYWKIDYAISRHPVLNLAHQISLTYFLKGE